jgi:hypothetical protein
MVVTSLVRSAKPAVRRVRAPHVAFPHVVAGPAPAFVTHARSQAVKADGERYMHSALLTLDPLQRILLFCQMVARCLLGYASRPTARGLEAPDHDSAFPRLSEDQLARLERFGARRRTQPEEALFLEGDRMYDFYVVLDGKVAVLDGYRHPRGAPHRRSTVRVGSSASSVCSRARPRPFAAKRRPRRSSTSARPLRARRSARSDERSRRRARARGDWARSHSSRRARRSSTAAGEPREIRSAGTPRSPLVCEAPRAGSPRRAGRGQAPSASP